MSGVDLKGEAIIGDDVKGGNVARVINGRLLVRFVSRAGSPQAGYGSAQLKGGIAAHNQAQVINGALKVRLN